MRSAVNEIVKFNRGFHALSLKAKLIRMSASPFFFFRGTFHLFARDLVDGPFRKWPCLEASGQIVADLHTENFGTFRAMTGEIVYDINDFDETAPSPYEFDVRRLATSLILASLDNKHPMGEGAIAAELCVRGYLDTLGRLGKLKTRSEFEHLKERRDTREVLATAGEHCRADMMKRVAVESSAGKFVIHNQENYLPVSNKVRAQALEALPRFLKSCLAPIGSQPERFSFQDVAFRIAGAGSLGRQRYAVLLGKGKGRESFETLRLMEWKDSLDSSLVTSKPTPSKNRARDVLKAMLAFQVLPKRYLGYTLFDGRSMQGREIGANDVRFKASEFADIGRFHHAARIFGEVTARCHLVSTIGKRGPRALIKELAGGKDERWIRRMVAFAVAYADQTLDDYAEFCDRKAEVAKHWDVQRGNV